MGVLNNYLRFVISTHALTWSATWINFEIVKNSICISTHALTWSATALVTALITITVISTHALTWSAT